MSSDKITATIQLVGYASQNVRGLDENTDYRMIVSTDEGTAEKIFSIPGVEDEEVVTAVDSSKQTITVNGSTYTDKDSLILDYEHILGRTVTLTYDKDNNISDIDVLDETIIYTAVSKNDADSDGTVDSVKTTEKDVYTLVTDEGGNGRTKSTKADGGSIYPTEEILLDAGTSIIDGADGLKYAKIVLNPNGTVRSIVEIEDWESTIYVASVEDSKYVVDVAGQYTDLSSFRILKDGMSADVEDIEEGDVVFLSTDNDKKVAEIYSENTKEGAMTVYLGKIDIGSDRLTLEASSKAVIGDSVKAATTDNLSDYDGADVVGYLDRANKLAQLVVDDEAAATASELVVLTANAIMYTEGKDVILEFNAGNGTSVDTYTVNVADLKSIKVGAADLKYDKNTAPKVGGLITDTHEGTFGIDNDGSFDDVTVDGTVDLLAGDLVKVIKNADGDVIGLEMSNGTAADYDFNAGQNPDIVLNPAAADKYFAGGSTAMKSGELIAGTTPVYVYNTTNKTVALYDYADVNFTATANAANQIQARLNPTTKSVVAFYIDETKSTLGQSLVAATVRGIIDSVVYDKTNTNYAEIVAYTGSEKITYKTFAQDVAKCGDDAKGHFIDIKLTEDGEVFGVADVAETAAEIGELDVANFKVDDDYILTTETGVVTTILVKDAAGNYATKSWSELGTLADKTAVINVALYGDSTNYVDAIYVELDDGTAQAEKAAAEAEQDLINGLGAAVTAQTADIANADLATTNFVAFSVAGITAAGIDLEDATYEVADGVGNTGTSDGFNGDYSAIKLTPAGVADDDEFTITITTALGNEIEIVVTVNDAG